jgi:small neutral amino acid transporter SnatA (MarC family)
MLLLVGGLLVVTGLTFALVLQSGFAIVGALLMVSGGILLALAAEPLLSAPHPRADTSAEAVAQQDEIVA